MSGLTDPLGSVVREGRCFDVLRDETVINLVLKAKSNSLSQGSSFQLLASGASYFNGKNAPLK